MDKWADYLISAVCYDEEETHIKKVKQREDKGDEVGPAKEVKRSVVVENLEDNFSYVTIKKKDNGKWKRGEDVHILEIEGEKFIRTDRNEEKSDNLGDLPEFNC